MNIFSLPYMFFLYYLIQNNNKPEFVFLLGSVDIIIHAYFGCYFIGYESNFIYFILSLPMVLYLGQNWTLNHKKIYLLIIGLLLFFGIYFLKSHTPKYNLDEELIKNISILVILVLAIGVFFIVYRFNEIVKENDVALLNTNKILVKQNLENDKQLKRQDILLREIHHRMKNNFQIVTSLLRIQSNEIKDQKAISLFKETQNRVLSLAKLHEKMYRSENLENINTEEHFTLLVVDLITNYTLKKGIRASISVDNIDLGIKTLVPLGLIINEVITNSLKYAFINQDSGTISVQLRHITNNQYELVIGDDGCGKKNTKAKTGLGTKLIHIFTKQLKGTIKRLEKKGTVYQILFEKIDD